ncbi:RTA1-domain-containing protein [Calocera cornea HHB12733]|uniref:RTA1-domain-containing protein n=1 Tax=Calocera cornea HHB12733 TaxID=1353952 RepID=A0A165IV22_9BASI|nr:RTA1-domain-containing protein [Calocera cornea HHB12733]
MPNTTLRPSPYGYVPTLYVCILYVVLFSLSTLAHSVQAARARLWWLFPTIVAGGLAEVIGWAGRLWSSKSVDNLNPFLMQITTTIMAPSFMTAANFLILGIIISRLGTQYSRLSPRLYSIVFITADVVALVVQAVGGGMASVAVQKRPPGDPEKGARIMVGGIVWQLAAMTVYVALALEFFLRVRLDKPQHGFGFAQGSKLSLQITALFLSTLLIYMRSIYRTVELLDGWTGRIITTEVYFNVLDAMPITLAMFTMNLLHPAWLLYGKGTGTHPKAGFEMMETDREARVEHDGEGQ